MNKETRLGFEPAPEAEKPENERILKYKELAKKRITERDAYGRPNEAQMESVMKEAGLTEEEQQQIRDEIEARIEKHRPDSELNLQNLRAEEQQWEDREKTAADLLGPEELAALEAETAAIQAERDEIGQAEARPPHKEKHPERIFSPDELQQAREEGERIQEENERIEKEREPKNLLSRLKNFFRRK